MKKNISIFILVVLLIGLVIYIYKRQPIQLDYYHNQNLLVNGKIGFELQQSKRYPINYLFENDICKVVFSEHE